MVSTQKNFTDFLNKEEFPYTIVNGDILYGHVYNPNGNNRMRIWSLWIKLFDKTTRIPITTTLLKKTTLPSSYLVQLHTETGLIDGKITISSPTIIQKGKNIGKKNETTVLTQALIDGRSMYDKKIKSGYSTTKEVVTTLPKQTFPFPMAVQSYPKYKHKLVYPLYIQPKLDGVRMVAKWVNGKVVIQSRRLHELADFEFIKKELEPILSKHPDLYIDGELYNHSMQLQQISGIVRAQLGDTTAQKQLQFWVFDCFDIHQSSMLFEERITLLQSLFDSTEYTYLKLVPSHLIQSEKEGDMKFKQYVKDKYEGIIYKNKHAIYEFSFTKEKRSMQYQKRKACFDAEYKIVGFTQGDKGKDVGAVIFIMETKKKITFHGVPNATYEERYAMYQDCILHFDSKYKNKMATIQYDDLSAAGVPLRARFITVRDYE